MPFYWLLTVEWQDIHALEKFTSISVKDEYGKEYGGTKMNIWPTL